MLAEMSTSLKERIRSTVRITVDKICSSTLNVNGFPMMFGGTFCRAIISVVHIVERHRRILSFALIILSLLMTGVRLWTLGIQRPLVTRAIQVRETFHQTQKIRWCTTLLMAKRRKLTDPETLEPVRYCARPKCKETIPWDATRNQKWCSESCRTKFLREKGKREEALKESKEARDELAKFMGASSEEVQDETRALVREELQAAVGPMVKKHVSEGMLVMTSLIPQVAENLRKSLNSKSFMERRHAEQMILKYGMEFYQGGGAEQTAAKIVFNVAGDVKPPDEVVEGSVESYEADWKECHKCGERYADSNLEKDDEGFICSSCRVLRDMSYD